MTAEELRKEFPSLERRIESRPLVYFDNAATSMRPISVVEFLKDSNINHNANIHRAVHLLAVEATEAYEASREQVRKFLGAASRDEIIFTSGTTAAINLVSYSFAERYLQKGDEVIVGVSEHHSNFVPWQIQCQRKGVTIKYLYPGKRGVYETQDLKQLLSEKTRLVCIGHSSNVLGIVNPLTQLIALSHSAGAKVLVDGAQGAVHRKVDVQALDCDFYAFSAHKLFGPTGVGVLYGKKQLLEEMPPFMYGGEMVGTVSTNGTTFAPLPQKFEAGTQNFINVAALVPALVLFDKVLQDKELNEQFNITEAYLQRALKNIDGLHLWGDDDTDKLPIYSFTIDGVHHEDLAILLDKMGVAVRSGQMCAEPLMTHCGVTGMVRASLLQYNTVQEAEYFVKSLERAIGMLR